MCCTVSSRVSVPSRLVSCSPSLPVLRSVSRSASPSRQDERANLICESFPPKRIQHPNPWTCHSSLQKLPPIATMASAQSSRTSTAGQEEPSPTQQAVVVPPPLSKRPFLIYIMLRGYVDLERKKLRKGAIDDVAHKLGIKSSAVQRQ